MTTALVRAVTAIPGHASFGVFMGVWYGFAKKLEVRGNLQGAQNMRKKAVIIPALIHGSYDFIASMESHTGSWLFLIFIAALFFIASSLIRKMSSEDKEFYSRTGFFMY